MLKAEFFDGEIRLKKLAALTGVMLMAAAEALAQDKAARPARKIVVSIPDRKLAVLEAGRVSEDLPHRRGRAEIAESRGLLHHRAPPDRPDLVWERQDCSPRKRQPDWYALARSEREGLRHSRHQQSELHRSQRVARLHPSSQPGHRTVVRHGFCGRRSRISRRENGGDCADLRPRGRRASAKRKRRHSVTGSKRQYLCSQP